MTTVTSIERVTPEQLAMELSDRQRIQRAIRASGKGIKMGRTSAILGDGVGTPTVGRQIKGLFQQYASLAYQLPWEILDYVEMLATYNPDYSQAVENIKMLANSGYEVMVGGSDLQVRRTKDLIEEKSRIIQEPHGGMDGIMDKLLDQACTFGAMCGEWVLNEDMTDVVDFVDLSPKKIRFFWIEELQTFAPFQLLNHVQATEARKQGREMRGNCVRLNPLTFRYYAFDAAPESPYGTPPFLAALVNIAIQRDMVHNMGQIVKKIGLLGMVDLTIERLEPLAAETDDQYAARASQYLDDYVSVAEEMVRDGGLVHFDDVQAQMVQLGGNAAGATNIHKANEEMVFSGLKSMPSVQGRSYSTTETYAGVAYDIILRNTRKYQRAAKRMAESGFWLMATLNGLTPEKIAVTFNENRSINRQQEALAYKTEINNAFMLWLLGILDQTGVAQTLGFAEAKTPMEDPPESLLGIASAHAIDTVPDSDFGTAPVVRGKMEEPDDEEDE